ncbi:hypothetical protein HaLaN_31479, partial [Haematococcus lacustris]
MSRYWIDFQVLSSPLSTTLLERALRAVGQVVSIVPGLLSVSRKTSLVSTLRLAYGDHT